MILLLGYFIFFFLDKSILTFVCHGGSGVENEHSVALITKLFHLLYFRWFTSFHWGMVCISFLLVVFCCEAQIPIDHLKPSSGFDLHTKFTLISVRESDWVQYLVLTFSQRSTWVSFAFSHLALSDCGWSLGPVEFNVSFAIDFSKYVYTIKKKHLPPGSGFEVCFIAV